LIDIYSWLYQCELHSNFSLFLPILDFIINWFWFSLQALWSTIFIDMAESMNNILILIFSYIFLTLTTNIQNIYNDNDLFSFKIFLVTLVFFCCCFIVKLSFIVSNFTSTFILFRDEAGHSTTTRWQLLLKISMDDYIKLMSHQHSITPQFHYLIHCFFVTFIT